LWPSRSDEPDRRLGTGEVEDRNWHGRCRREAVVAGEEHRADVDGQGDVQGVVERQVVPSGPRIPEQLSQLRPAYGQPQQSLDRNLELVSREQSAVAPLP
jgi:hypothetical protein